MANDSHTAERPGKLDDLYPMEMVARDLIRAGARVWLGVFPPESNESPWKTEEAFAAACRHALEEVRGEQH